MAKGIIFKEFADTNISIDKHFLEHIQYAATAEIEDIQQRMKRNLEFVGSSNPFNYARILQCYNTYHYWGKINPQEEVYDLIENRSKALKEHHEDWLWLYSRLCDYRSKKTLLGMLDNWITFNMVSLDQIIERAFLPYFDLDVIRCDTSEVFVDLGAYIGDTVLHFLNSYTTYKRIYCYEIVPALFQTLKQNLERHPNIEFRQKGAGDRAGILFVSEQEPDQSMHKLSDSGAEKVSVVTLDDDITEPVTFIKMDIEGGEQKALLGCKNHIQSNHPKLAIAIYHNNEDIWKCARMIDEFDSGYQFYLRYYGGNYYPSECVLLGI